MDPLQEYIQLETRRQFFRHGALGLGSAALASLWGDDAGAAVQPAGTDGLSDLPHFPSRAKRVIYLFMSGAPAQMDMYDYKPEMRKKYKTDLKTERGPGGELILQNRVTTMTSGQDEFPIVPSIYDFEQCGESGAWVSELLPHTKTMVDELCFIKSMWTEAINHDPAITFIQTGDQIPGRPSLGAWLSYGLGSMNGDLPTFVVMNSTWSAKRDAQAIYNRLWGSGFLASRHQGVMLRSQGDPVLFLSNPAGVNADLRRRMLDSLARLNQRRYEALGDPETQARIDNYEMAFRMQTSIPELTDLSQEPEHVFEMYGPDSRKPGTFAYHCLLARRLAERGVRLTQIFHRGWDQHGNLTGDLPLQCRDIDQASTALVKDLKQRGLLDDTLVIWGGEFGRTIYCQGHLTETNYGRDHHPKCFTIWMTGAGIRPGMTYGETDEYGVNVTQNPVHVRDLNATILERLGIDHRRLSFRFQGLDVRLTGVEDEARVLTDVMA